MLVRALLPLHTSVLHQANQGVCCYLQCAKYRYEGCIPIPYIVLLTAACERSGVHPNRAYPPQPAPGSPQHSPSRAPPAAGSATLATGWGWKQARPTPRTTNSSPCPANRSTHSQHFPAVRAPHCCPQLLRQRLHGRSHGPRTLTCAPCRHLQRERPGSTYRIGLGVSVQASKLAQVSW